MSSYLYNLHRLDRKVSTKSGNVKQGGGICVYTRHDISVNELFLLSTSNEDLELLTLTLKLGFQRRIKLCAVHRPPTCNCDRALVQLSETLDVIDREFSGDTVLIGDFNINLADHKNHHVKRLKAFTDSRSLTQLIEDFTRVTLTSEMLIDHIFTNNPHVSLFGTINVNISDHYPIFVTIKKTRCSKKFTEVQGRNYKKADLSEYEEEIRNIDHQNLFASPDPNEVWQRLYSHIMSTIDRLFPIQTFKIPVGRPGYIDDSLAKLMKQRDTAFHCARRTPTPEHWALAKSLRRSQS